MATDRIPASVYPLIRTIRTDVSQTQLLEISEGAVKSHLYRTLEEIRRRYRGKET